MPEKYLLGKRDSGKGAYFREWKARDAGLQANGFPPSKLGPGVPAVTTTSVFGSTTIWDDSGIKISGGKDKA